MNETLKVLEARRSCRSFKPDMITEDELKAVIKARTYAPTGMGKQSPIIIAVTNKEMRDKISKENSRIMGVEGDFEGIGHCALGYKAEPSKEAAPRKDNYVYFIR